MDKGLQKNPWQGVGFRHCFRFREAEKPTSQVRQRVVRLHDQGHEEDRGDQEEQTGQILQSENAGNFAREEGRGPQGDCERHRCCGRTSRGDLRKGEDQSNNTRCGGCQEAQGKEDERCHGQELSDQTKTTKANHFSFSLLHARSHSSYYHLCLPACSLAFVQRVVAGVLLVCLLLVCWTGLKVNITL